MGTQIDQVRVLLAERERLSDIADAYVAAGPPLDGLAEMPDLPVDYINEVVADLLGLPLGTD